MLMVVNGSYGGFSIPDEVCEMLGVDKYDDEYEIRENKQFIDWVLTHENDDLVVVEVPDGYTDCYIENYDGLETLLYVLDGKIHFADEYISEEEDE